MRCNIPWNILIRCAGTSAEVHGGKAKQQDIICLYRHGVPSKQINKNPEEYPEISPRVARRWRIFCLSLRRP
jgi:hypothetical protein